MTSLLGSQYKIELSSCPCHYRKNRRKNTANSLFIC